MSLETYLARRLGRTATPATPAEIQGLQPRTAQTLACTPATPETPKTATSAANDADDLHALLAAHGDGSAGGVDWSAWRLTAATSSPAWAIVNPRGLTLLLTVEPITKPRSYAQAWPVERIARWPDDEDDAEQFEERAAIIEEGCQVDRAEAERMAGEVIKRARSCWGCRNLHTTTSTTDSLPRCNAGHRLVCRTTATRTWPGRLDAHDCGDRAA